MKYIDKENVRAVIFDLDGTLIDTEKIYRKVWPEAMAHFGLYFTDEMCLSLRSLGRPFAPERFKEWYGNSECYYEARAYRKELFNAYVDEHGIDRKQGAVELLTYLRKEGIITAIATATDIERAENYLKMTGLYGYFDKIISAVMVDEGKPSPKVYQYACKELGLEPSMCIAVEDAPNGIISAYDAGLKVIMVPDQTEPDDMLREKLFACVKSLDELIEE